MEQMIATKEREEKTTTTTRCKINISIVLSLLHTGIYLDIIDSLCYPLPEHPHRLHVFSVTTRTGDTYCCQVRCTLSAVSGRTPFAFSHPIKPNWIIGFAISIAIIPRKQPNTR